MFITGKLNILITGFLFFLLFGCVHKHSEQKKHNDTIVSQYGTRDKDTLEPIDNSFIDTVTIMGEKYSFYYLFEENYCYVLNQKNDTVFSDSGSWFTIEMADVNKDGYEDLLLTLPSNTASVQDLALYDKVTKKFIKVQDFPLYPDTKKISGTSCYYSYHKSGCADLNWDSDLFYIENYKTIHIGNIYGEGCLSDGRQKIYIKKIKNRKETPIDTLPIEIIVKFDDYKWGFIEDYWTKNYKKFKK